MRPGSGPQKIGVFLYSSIVLSKLKMDFDWSSIELPIKEVSWSWIKLRAYEQKNCLLYKNHIEPAYMEEIHLLVYFITGRNFMIQF